MGVQEPADYEDVDIETNSGRFEIKHCDRGRNRGL